MKALRRVLAALQILLLGCTIVLYYLCQQRMGVARHIVYLTNKWQSVLNLDILFFGLLALFLLVACWQILRHHKCGQGLRLYTSWLLLLLMSLGVAGFMLLYHGSGLRPYYQILTIFAAILLLQLLKCLVGQCRLYTPHQ